MESPLTHSDFGFPIEDGRFPDMLLQIELIAHSEGSTTIDNENAGVAVVKQLHICSRILAHQSPFFHKLFSNLTGESELRCVTLKIYAAEEAAFMELLKFMYSNTLSVKAKVGLFEVLMAAKKFEVASCMIHCSQLLRNMAMITPDSALHYLKLPSIDAYQPLIDATKKYIVVLYKEINNQWFEEEFMNLPLAGVEAILTNDEIQVESENVVYDFVLKWARKHYENLEERKQILGTRLAPLIRFPYLSHRKLKKVLTCKDFDQDVASKLVLDALSFKGSLSVEMSASSSRHRLMKRAYKYRLVKTVNFKSPTQRCVVYMDLKREECANMFPSSNLYSQAFKLGGYGFYFYASCCMDSENSFHCFGLFLGIQEVEASISVNCDYEFAARSKPTNEFICVCKNNYTFTGGKAVGYRNVFRIPWTLFMAQDSLYFINDLLHLRVEVTIKH